MRPIQVAVKLSNNYEILATLYVIGTNKILNMMVINIL